MNSFDLRSIQQSLEEIRNSTDSSNNRSVSSNFTYSVSYLHLFALCLLLTFICAVSRTYIYFLCPLCIVSYCYHTMLV